MSKRRLVFTILVLAAIGALVYSQVRTWRSFDWQSFWEQTRDVNPWLVLLGVAGIYTTYLLRAVRWKVFLRPVRQARARQLISPTIIGFTGLALLGRPGELVRPYLIARREELTLTSQIGVWAVERIFDVGAFALMLAVDILTSSQLRDLRYFSQIQKAGYALVLLTAALALGAFVTWRWTDAVAYRLCQLFTPFSHHFARAVEHKVQTFGQGLHTLRNLRSFLEAFGLSMLIWIIIALSYLSVVNSYPHGAFANLVPALEGLRVLPSEMGLAHIFPLMGSSMAGSVVQLPAVGGGSQLAIIAVLVAVFQVPNELAVSCGMMLWLVTFMACIPGGLLLARHEHVSLRKLTRESEEEEEEEESAYERQHPEPGRSEV